MEKSRDRVMVEQFDQTEALRCQIEALGSMLMQETKDHADTMARFFAATRAAAVMRERAEKAEARVVELAATPGGQFA